MKNLSPKIFLTALSIILSSCLTLSDKDLEVSEKILKSESMAWNKDSKSIWPGLYSGYLYMGQSKKAYAFESSLLFHRYAGNVIKSKMIITALQGGFSSHEYSSEYFSFVDIDTQSGKVTVKGDSLVKFSNVKLNGKILTGEVEVRGVRGEFISVWNEQQSILSVESNDDIQGNLTGIYKGICKGKKISMALNIKKISFKRPVVNFLKMPLTGTMTDIKKCEKAKCNSDRFFGTVDLAKEIVALKGNGLEEKCKIRGKNGALDCGGCLFVRKKEVNLPDEGRLSVDRSDFISLVNASDFTPNPEHSDIVGDYRGFLVSEDIGLAQPISLSVSSFRRGNKVYLSGSSRHYWQDKINDHYTEYPFLKRRYKKDRSVIVFDGVSDGLLYITGTYRGSLVGNWYSKSSGLLGQVILKKDTSWDALPLSKATNLVNNMYVSKVSEIKLSMKPSVSKAHYDFFPNKLYGVEYESKNREKSDVFLAGIIDRRSGYFALLNKKRKLTVGSIYSNEIQKEKLVEISKNGKLNSSYDLYRSVKVRTSVKLNPNVKVDDVEMKSAVNFESLLQKVEEHNQTSF
jgi:hypothetical protein